MNTLRMYEIFLLIHFVNCYPEHKKCKLNGKYLYLFNSYLYIQMSLDKFCTKNHVFLFQLVKYNETY